MIGAYLGGHKDLSIQEEFSYVRDAGFGAVFVRDERKEIAEVFPLLKEAGMICESIHAPFGRINDIWEKKEEGEQMLDRLKQSFLFAERYEVPVVVVHGSDRYPGPHINEMGLERFLNLCDFAKERGITIAFENLRTISHITYLMEQCPDAKFCWDVGHEECRVKGARFMPIYGHRLAAIHIHDNFSLEDDHLLPYDGLIDFERVARDLADSNYQGSVMLELVKRHPIYDCLSYPEFYQRAAASARKLEQRVLELRARQGR